MSNVWENSQHKGGKLLLLLALADFSNEKGFAFPSIETLADRSRMTPRNVQLILAELVESKELEVMRGQGPHGCNLYRITLRNNAQHGGEKISGGEISKLKTSSPPDEISKQKISPNPSVSVRENRKEPESVIEFPFQKEIKERPKAFVKPSVDEIIEHGATINFPESECKSAYNYWQSNGWMVGRNPMKCWKHALLTRKENWKKWGGMKQKQVEG
jgi:hypothetical protein